MSLMNTHETINTDVSDVSKPITLRRFTFIEESLSSPSSSQCPIYSHLGRSSGRLYTFILRHKKSKILHHSPLLISHQIPPLISFRDRPTDKRYISL